MIEIKRLACFLLGHKTITQFPSTPETQHQELLDAGSDAKQSEERKIAEENFLAEEYKEYHTRNYNNFCFPDNARGDTGFRSKDSSLLLNGYPDIDQWVKLEHYRAGGYIYTKKTYICERCGLYEVVKKEKDEQSSYMKKSMSQGELKKKKKETILEVKKLTRKDKKKLLTKLKEIRIQEIL